mgnify:CR=1 FL=1
MDDIEHAYLNITLSMDVRVELRAISPSLPVAPKVLTGNLLVVDACCVWKQASTIKALVCSELCADGNGRV